MGTDRIDYEQIWALSQRLSHPAAAVRIRAVRDLADLPYCDLVLEDLTHALDDRDAAVREAVVQALDGIRAAHPEALAELMAQAGDEEHPPIVALARYLVHVGTPDAIEAALPVIAGDALGQERQELLEMLAGAAELTDERLKAMVDGASDLEGDLHRTAAEIFALRGHDAGWRALFRAHRSRWFFDDFIDRGPVGIRILCRAFPEPDCVDDEIAERMAARRKKTEATVREIIADPSSGGLRTAVAVLGYWDEPRNVEILVNLAQDPRQAQCVRDEAIRSLCRIEAPEAMDLFVATLLDRSQRPGIRSICAQALGDIGKPEPLEVLASVASGDPDETLRRYASNAIENIQYPEAA